VRTEASERVILSAAGAKDLLAHRCEGRLSGAAGADDLRCGVEEQQVLRSRACRALAQDDNAARGLKENEGGRVVSLFSLPEASELVILSAAGAKDLLAHRCEGRWSGAAGAEDLLSHGCEGRLSGAAGADDLRCGVEEQQVLRSRACRALAQDDNAARFKEAV